MTQCDRLLTVKCSNKKKGCHRMTSPFFFTYKILHLSYSIGASAATGESFSSSTGSPCSRIYSGAMSIVPLHHSSVSEMWNCFNVFLSSSGAGTG